MRFRSIRTRLIVYFSSLILLTFLIFMFFSIRYTKKNIMENSEENSRMLIEQVNFNIENYVEYMESISQTVINNRDMEEYLFENGSEEVRANLTEQFQTLLQARKDIFNIAIIGNDGKYLINDGNSVLNPGAYLEHKEWYQEAKAAGADITISSSHVQNMIQGEYPWVVTLSRGITNPNTNEIEGIMIIDMNYNLIRDLCESIRLGNKGYVYIVDRRGEIVYHPQQQLILSGVKKELLQEIRKGSSSISFTDENGEEKIYTSFLSDRTEWTLVGVVYTSELAKNDQTIRLIYFITAFALIALTITIAFIISGNIAKPIKRLQSAMQEVETGNFKEIHVEVGGDYEIATLNRYFNRMVEHIDELMRRNMKEQAEKRKSELKALQSQINPHFLYNTLDSIIWMIETDDSKDAIKMTSVLAKFFRQAIGNSDVYVTIRRELEYTKNYLLIQQMRYRDKITFDIHVDEEILDCRIVKLVLQPLVENALYHGLKYKTQQGSIQITGYRMEQKIIIKVMDNGVGIEKEKLDKIFEISTSRQNRERHTGVGLENIQSRLQLYYGDNYGLRIESEVDMGTTISITIPYQKIASSLGGDCVGKNEEE